MTVREMIDQLEAFDVNPEWPVGIVFDSGGAGDDVAEVRVAASGDRVEIVGEH